MHPRYYVVGGDIFAQVEIRKKQPVVVLKKSTRSSAVKGGKTVRARTLITLTEFQFKTLFQLRRNILNDINVEKEATKTTPRRVCKRGLTQIHQELSGSTPSSEAFDTAMANSVLVDRDGGLQQRALPPPPPPLTPHLPRGVGKIQKQRKQRPTIPTSAPPSPSPPPTHATLSITDSTITTPARGTISPGISSETALVASVGGAKSSRDIVARSMEAASILAPPTIITRTGDADVIDEGKSGNAVGLVPAVFDGAGSTFERGCDSSASSGVGALGDGTLAEWLTDIDEKKKKKQPAAKRATGKRGRGGGGGAVTKRSKKLCTCVSTAA